MNTTSDISDAQPLPTEDTARFALQWPYEVAGGAWLDDPLPCADSFIDRPKAMAGIFSAIAAGHASEASRSPRCKARGLKRATKDEGMDLEMHGQSGQTKLALSRVEAAHALGMSPISIDRLTKRGLLHPSKATRRPLYPVWEIERFLRETTLEIDAQGEGKH